MLPEVLASEKDAGVLSHNWFDIPSGTPIGVALGDLQCSVRSTLIDSDTDAVLNVSTSAQMAFVKKPPFHPNDKVGVPPFFLTLNKGHIFWEGHKIWKYPNFIWQLIIEVKKLEDFYKIVLAFSAYK